jgi:hypothetical protein
VSDAGGAGGRLPAANWYADPQDPKKLRWWDGAKWTVSVRDAVVPEPGAVRSRERLRSPAADDRPPEISAERQPQIILEPSTHTSEIVLAPKFPQQTAASLSALVAGLGQEIAPTARPTTTASVRVQWVDHPHVQHNPPATAALVTGVLSILFNPLLILSLVAWIAGGIGLRRGGGRRRAGWGIVLGITGALVWGFISIFAIAHPVSFKIQWWNMPSAVSTLKAASPGVGATYGDWDVAWFIFDTCEMADTLAPAMKQYAGADMSDPSVIAGASQMFAKMVTYAGKHAVLLAAVGSSISDDPSSDVMASMQFASTAAYTAACPGVMADLAYATTLVN